MNAAQADSLMCFASERGIQELCLEIIGSKDKRAMNRDEREWFDVETIKQMELVSRQTRQRSPCNSSL